MPVVDSLNREVKAGPDGSERTYTAVGNCNMGRVYGIALESLLRLESAIQHEVSIGRSKSAVNLNLYVNETGNDALKRFQALLDGSLDGNLLFFGQCVLQSPQNDMLYHSINYLQSN